MSGKLLPFPSKFPPGEEIDEIIQSIQFRDKTGVVSITLKLDNGQLVEQYFTTRPGPFS